MEESKTALTGGHLCLFHAVVKTQINEQSWWVFFFCVKFGVLLELKHLPLVCTSTLLVFVGLVLFFQCQVFRARLQALSNLVKACFNKKSL